MRDVTIIPTVMRVAFERATFADAQSPTVKSCVKSLGKGVGLIRRRQLWNRQRGPA